MRKKVNIIHYLQNVVHDMKQTRNSLSCDVKMAALN